MKVIVICVNGYPESGKTLFEDYCCDYHKNSLKISSIDYVKEVARSLGWNGEKTPESRKFLSDLKKILVNTPWGDLPIQSIYDAINKKVKELKGTKEDLIVFCDVREPEELEKMKQVFGSTNILINKELAPGTYLSNSSDSQVLDYNYDYIIDNNGTKEELKESAELFINQLMEKRNEF